MAEIPNLKVKMVELLSVWPGEANVGSPARQEPVVILTVRPEPTSFEPYNLAITAAQAQRLAEDLVSLLETFSCLRILLLALLTVGFGGGCSARYEAREENKADFGSERNVTAEKSSLSWQVDLMPNRSPTSKAPGIEPKAESRPAGGTVNVFGGTVIIVVPADSGRSEQQGESAAYESKKRSGLTGLKTRIGWPSDYWQHGFWASLGALVVWVLIFYGFMAVLGGDPLPGILLWLIAFLLLQALPCV